jgi:uncharacterized protein YkwD
MKKQIILLFIPLLFGFNNRINDDQQIISYFEQILNEYRTSNGLSKVVIDESMKKFTDIRSKSLVEDYSHNGFKENVNSYISDFTTGGENIAILSNIKNDQKPYYSSSIKEIGDILNKMAMGTSTNYDVAYYCFLVWKNSKPHNDFLLNKKIKRFYLSYEKTEHNYFFCFIGVD